MKNVVYVYVRPAASGFFAECFDLPVSAQGPSLDQVIDVIEDSLNDYFKNNDPLQFGFEPTPEVLVTMHLGPPAEE